MPIDILIDCETGEVVEREVDPLPVLVPVEVTQAQAKIALERAGLYAAAEAAIAAAGVEAQIWWNCALTFRRDHPLIAVMASPEVLDLTEAEVDDLFRTAATIV